MLNDREQAVLHANQAFYDAFIDNDYAAMAALWASAREVTVIHPGWAPLFGQRAVLDSWQRILGGTGRNRMQCTSPRAFLGADLAFVICTETFPEGELVATNVFVLEDATWKMVHHQSGPQTAAGGERAGPLH